MTPRCFISGNIFFEFSVQCNLLRLGRTQKDNIFQLFFISKHLWNTEQSLIGSSMNSWLVPGKRLVWKIKKEKGTKLLMMTFEFRSTCYLIAVFPKN
jgi:hypothetical protein